MPMPILQSCRGQGRVLRLFSLLVLVLCGSRSVALSPEGRALDDMRLAFQGDPQGAFSTWDVTLVNPCSWIGVSCTGDEVTEVLLPGKGLSGPLSPRVADLVNLLTLKLSDNNISGGIPEAIGRLSKLVTLDLGSNRFSGPIPESVSNLSVLQNLVLKNNLLSGGIPAGLSSIPTLKAVDLSNNNLSGRVPEDPPGVVVNVTGNALLCGEKVRVQCPGDPPLTPPQGDKSGGGSSSAGALGGAVAAAAVVAALALALLALWWRRQRRGGGLYSKEEFFDVQEEQDLQIRFAQLREFSLREMQMATDTFHSRHILGQGGFGKVYKGTLEDGSEVAVKRLNRAGGGGAGGGGERAFQMEVEMIGLAVHRHLLRLQGFCVTQAERILVYPYMRNGSVAQRLRETNPGLDWYARRKIAVGSARGLAYLHDFCEPKIIHRDVKAANVLLDEELEAVVGDFGLAKLLDGSQTHITTMVRGTAGHIAPEYLTTGKSSEKTDVFGYGIMLLELLTGQRAFDFARLAAEDDVMLLDWVKRLQLEGRQAELVDPNLRSRAGGYDPGEAEELIQVALLCTQGSPGDRPRMAEVVRMLEGDGLAERWQEWQRVEVVRRHDTDLLPRNLPQWVHDSTGNIDAFQLSSGR